MAFVINRKEAGEQIVCGEALVTTEAEGLLNIYEGSV